MESRPENVAPVHGWAVRRQGQKKSRHMPLGFRFLNFEASDVALADAIFEESA
jgi:hypothetical protein